MQRLLEYKRAARASRGCDRLAQAAPASALLLLRAAERAHNLGSITAALLRLLQRYGAAALQAAILEALARDVPHPNAVRLAVLARESEETFEIPAEPEAELQASLAEADHGETITAAELFEWLRRIA